MAPLSAISAPIYVIRHAKARERHRWSGDDRFRPLTKGGLRKAEALATLLRGATITHIVSSPYLRCLETVAPLARRSGVPVETSTVLAEGADPTAVMTMIGGADGNSVLCSHGDVILALLEHLVGQGVLRASDVHAEKGSAWLLQRVDGQVAYARHLRVSV